MITYAAPATWGIGEPTFLLVYLGAAVAVGLLAAIHHRRATAGGATTPTGSLSAHQVAFLHGGERLAVHTSLGALRAAGALGTNRDRTLVQTGSLPAGATGLDTAVYNAAGRRIRAASVYTDPWVTAALTRLREESEAAGLVTTPAQRRTMRVWALAAFALAGLGLVRVVAGLIDDGPVGLLLPLAVLVLLQAIYLQMRVTRQTRAGSRTVTRMRLEHHYLAPESNPAYAVYGADGAAMAVALYGSSTLHQMDPTFATQAQVKRQATHASSSSSSGSCGGGTSAASCGGGSSCGGGGCGGGS